MFSDFAPIRRFSGVFIDQARPKRALTHAADATFTLFSLKGKSVVPFRDRQQARKSITWRMLLAKDGKILGKCVGSTSGLLFSLSYLAQCHSSMGQLREVLATIGPKKPLKGYTDQVLRSEGNSAQAKLASANIAVNNAQDVEYYKFYAYSPRTNIDWMFNEPHFESVGHGYFVVYGQLVGMLANAIDPEHVILPNPESWDSEILRLGQERIIGYYWRSPVQLPAVGLRAVYEGQARFTQLQFLDGARDEPLSCTEWREKGYLSGIYVEAFESFLTLSKSEWPETLEDPLVALFLLICDLAMNPTRGLPIDIEVFENFIRDVDVGVRFTFLCQAVAKLPLLKSAITAYSKDEYMSVSDELTALVGYDHPIMGPSAMRAWLDHASGLSVCPHSGLTVPRRELRSMAEHRFRNIDITAGGQCGPRKLNLTRA